MRLPWTKAHPTELGFTALVLANHVVAAPVLLYSGPALGALLGVGGDPV